MIATFYLHFSLTKMSSIQWLSKGVIRIADKFAPSPTTVNAQEVYTQFFCNEGQCKLICKKLRPVNVVFFFKK